jgi:creatinine amidohydrolase
MTLYEAARSSSPDFGAQLLAGAIPILPFGALEQHGPHLPLATDTIMADGLARRIADEVGGILLPAIGYGQTSDNAAFPGTVTLSFDTVRAIAKDIAAALAVQGARAFVIVNGDFGNQAPLRQAAREIGEQIGIPILVVNYPGMAEIAADLCTTPPAGLGLYHAEEFETSLVLHLRPEDVRMERAVAEYPVYPPTFPAVLTGLDELSRSGVFGDPRPATAELGGRLMDRLADEAIQLVNAFLLTLPLPNREFGGHPQPVSEPPARFRSQAPVQKP